MTSTISGKGQTGVLVATPVREPAPRAAAAKSAAQDTAAAPADTVRLGTQIAFSDTYAAPGKAAPTSSADLQAILDESESKAQAVMNLILPLVEQQGLNLAKVVSGEQTLHADQATIDKAKAAIGEDGEFGVRQVADRILGFVQQVSGGDPDKLAAMRAAVEDGFKQAADMLGGALPDISEQTRTVIMDTFDSWAREAPAPA